MSKEFYAKLANIQQQLTVPKSVHNSFGGFNYRTCEGILRAVKPLLDGLYISISDETVMIGNRYYIKATAVITDGESSVLATAYAREEETKKGMDVAQITGSASSYARKYCLSGLLGIDDNKDPDADNNSESTNNPF